MSSQHPKFESPGDASERAEMSFSPSGSESASSEIGGVIDRHSGELLKIKGVYGVGAGRTPIGDDAVRVDIDNESIRGQLPQEIEGYPVEVVVVPGGFDILPATK